jgi:hypothetical protein
VYRCQVRMWSTIHFARRTYSVPSRLINCEVEARQHADKEWRTNRPPRPPHREILGGIRGASRGTVCGTARSTQTKVELTSGRRGSQLNTELVDPSDFECHWCPSPSTVRVARGKEAPAREVCAHCSPYLCVMSPERKRHMRTRAFVGSRSVHATCGGGDEHRLAMDTGNLVRSGCGGLAVVYGARHRDQDDHLLAAS